MKRRWTVVPVSIALVAAAGFWVSRSDGSHPSGFTAGPLVTYRDAGFGWTIRYPRTLRLGHFQGDGMFDTDGIRLTSFEPDLQAPSSGDPQMGWLRGFPPDGVALQLWFGQRIPLPPPLHDTALPLPFDSLKPVARYVGGSEPAPNYRFFWADGSPFSVAVWFGPQASRAGRTAVEAVLASLRFSPLPSWTFWRDTYYVLGSAADYPVGSFTLIPASRLPAPSGREASESIYLVHAPGGFYVVSASAYAEDQPPCEVVFDRSRSRFSCPSLGLVWDRLGRQVEPPPGASAEGIGPHPVGVTFDKQIVYSPYFGSVAFTDLWS